MTPRRVAGLLIQLLGVVVLIASAAYLLLYLYRWEWNRALVAGLFVVAAELAVVGGTLSRRLRRVERLLDEQARRDRERRIQTRLEAAPSRRPVSFAWLREPFDGTGVFVPALLGAGVVLSALAYVVERLAGATVDPFLQRDVAARLSALRLPEGGFLPQSGHLPQHGGLAMIGEAEPTRGRRGSWTVIALVAALLTAGAVAGLANVTQARDEPDRSGQDTRITLEVATKVPGTTPREAFTMLWGACRVRLPEGVGVKRLVVDGAGVQLTLDHGLGRTSARKLGGCLEDAVQDLVQASITEMVVLTGEPGVGPLDPRTSSSAEVFWNEALG